MNKDLLIAGLVVAIGIAAAATLVVRDVRHASALRIEAVAPIEVPSEPLPPLPEPVLPAVANPPQTQPARARGQFNARVRQAPPRPKQSQAAPVDPDHQDPIARVALSLVGADPEAEEYWIGAINNPNLSAVERESLISDLNEDGLSDIRRPTMDDLPLIVNRMRLIEQLAPDALDDVNRIAFAEAYQDLANLAEVAQGRGQPVR